MCKRKVYLYNIVKIKWGGMRSVRFVYMELFVHKVCICVEREKDVKIKME